MRMPRKLVARPLLVVLAAQSKMSSSLAFAPQPPPSLDWLEAELALRRFPPAPSADLPPERVASCCLRSLQLVDHPSPSVGLARIFPFLTWECRETVTARRTTGARALEEFRSRAVLSPVLQLIMGATRIELGEGTVSKGTATRGDIVSYPAVVYVAEVMAFQHKSGMIRDRVAGGPPRADLVLRLERARRPPVAGCWLVKEIVDTRYAKGGQGWSRHEGV